MITRRQFVTTTAVTLVGVGLASRAGAARAATAAATFTDTMTKLEADSRGRLGVAVIDTGSGMQLDHRAGERFPMCSTFKVLAASAVLRRVDDGKEDLARRITFSKADLVPYSPATEKRVGGDGMSVAEICAAAATLSDNTAGNLMLSSLGGPAGLNAFLRSIGDEVTRLDRIEPFLNEALDDDPRDTTTPSAMASTLRSLVLGDALSVASRDQLIAWMVACTTGGTRLRAGLPASWRVGDKTGTGDRGSANDVAVIWTPRAPLIVSVFLTGSSASRDQQSATIASVGRAVAEIVGA